MSSFNQHKSEQENDERFSALNSNTNAIRAIASAVEGTLGPKGLDTMLVDSSGDVIITNDGVTILNKMEVNHPAAKMLIQVARSQQSEIGDGTTTATILSSELLSEAVRQIHKGVPIPKIISGLRLGIELTTKYVTEQSRTIKEIDKSQKLYQIALIAGREHQDVAKLIVDAAGVLGEEKLKDSYFTFADTIVAHEGHKNELINGLIISKKPMNPQMPKKLESPRILAIQDAFEPIEIDEEALGTEIGFSKYLEYKEEFKRNLQKISALGVQTILVDRGVDPIAEEYCIDHQIMIIQRIPSKDFKKLIEHTGAKAVKRTGLYKEVSELEAYVGTANAIYQDEKLDKVRVIEGKGKPVATIMVGASTGEIVEERERIAKDAAASVQAAIKGGYVPGGGSIELYVARRLEQYKEQIKGLEGFGIQSVASALRKPMAQIVLNAGFNPLEKLEEVKVAQIEQKYDGIGINTDTGDPIDMESIGVIDPTLVKLHALKAAGETAEAILRIQTIIRMKPDQEEPF